MKRINRVFTYISCTFGMMPAALGAAIPATHRSGPVVVFAAKTPPDFAREVPEGTRYVGEKLPLETVPTSVPADHFAQRGAVGQHKHSLATGSGFVPFFA